MLKVENLKFQYSRNSAPVLDGATLELKQGEVGILLGKNRRAGRSPLMGKIF